MASQAQTVKNRIEDSLDEGAWPGYMRAFRRRIMSLPIVLSPDTAMVCGGSLLRALIGDKSCLAVDIDIFTFTEEAHTAIASKLASIAEINFGTPEYLGSVGPNSSKYRIMGADKKDFIVDLIKPIADRTTLFTLLNGFDVNVSKVATDGDHVHFASLHVKNEIHSRTLVIEPNTLHEGNIRIENRYRKYYDLGFRTRVFDSVEFHKYFIDLELGF